MLVMAVEEAAEALNNLALQEDVAIENLRPIDNDVLTTTGPALWTPVVMKSLSIAYGQDVTFEDVSGLKEPKLFGDVFVLTISGFAIGVPHS